MTNNILKASKYLFSCFLLFAFNASAQNISGIYSGTLINDSLKMVQNYELALSEYRGKITGYSYITFVTNDTFYYGIKRIKASRQNGELVVEDVEMLANNYPKRPDKGVRVINRIPLPPGQDTILDMKGKWETTATKKFYSISGALTLRRNDDSTQSPLIAHLTELKEVNYQDEKRSTKNIAKTEIKKPKEQEKQLNEVAYAESKPKEKPSVIITEAKAKQTQQKEIVSAQAVAAEQKITENKPAGSQPTATTQTAVKVKPALNSSNDIASSDKKVIENKSSSAITTTSTNNRTEQTKVAVVTTVQKPASEQQKLSTASATTNKEANETVQQAVVKQNVSNNPNIQSQSKETKSTANTTAAIASEPLRTANAGNKETNSIAAEVKVATTTSPIAQRASNTIQTVNVVSDSLVLSFYDNGVVDGDSISVYLNNENIISSVKLKEAAVKKTIYINGRTDDMKLTLVADNLGSIPPNTGLLIIQDGKERYQIRFSADLQTNASVILKKKP